MEKAITITAGDQWLEFTPRKNDPVLGQSYVDLSVSGIDDSVVTVQRQFNETVGWKDVDDPIVSDIETVLRSVSGGLYRVGVKAADYGSDEIMVIVRQ